MKNLLNYFADFIFKFSVGIIAMAVGISAIAGIVIIAGALSFGVDVPAILTIVSFVIIAYLFGGWIIKDLEKYFN